MRRVSFLFSLLFALTVAGCAAKGPAAGPAKPKPYTKSEKTNMTLCIGIADTVRHAAIQKLKGVPIQDVKAEYAKSPDRKLQEASVSKAYHDKFTSAWDYTLAFFTECAKNLAEVAPGRSGLAGYCFQNQLIADVAFGYREKGEPKQNAYEHFASFRSDAPNAIIDKVYSSERSRSQIKLDIWDECMAKLTGG